MVRKVDGSVHLCAPGARMMLRGATSTCLATHGRGCLGQGRTGHCGGGRAVSRFRNRRLRASSETVIVHELFGKLQTNLYLSKKCMAPVNTTGNWYPACYDALCPETGVTHCTNPSLGHVGGCKSFPCPYTACAIGVPPLRDCMACLEQAPTFASVQPSWTL
eukprot:symbB.v1.2.018974.t1/scaffold1534.1/size113260/4